ncbi:MAG: S-layer homology domain-containing protein [Eubacterium sp.]|nr:S-layer homology domain-containing protein [Eubacterium sp.]
MKLKGKKLVLIIAALVFVAVSVSLGTTMILAKSNDVKTVKADTCVYCGGIYNFKVEPVGFTAKSYQWYSKLDGIGNDYTAKLDMYAPEDWFYDTDTPELKFNTVKFAKGGDPTDWGALKFYCEITDISGKKHYSEDFTMNIRSLQELMDKWKEEENQITYQRNVSPAVSGTRVTNLTMNVGESKTFSFTEPDINSLPYWFRESDPYFVNSVSYCNSDFSVNETVEGTSLTFKPEKAGCYLVSLDSALKYGRGYDSYYGGACETFVITVNDASQATVEKKEIGALQAAVQIIDNYKEDPAEGDMIPTAKIFPVVKQMEIADFDINWYKYTDKGWKNVKSLGETSFKKNSKYRCLAEITAKEGYEFEPDYKMADATILRVSLLQLGSKRLPNMTYMPASGSTRERVVFDIVDFVIQDDSDSPGSDDVIGISIDKLTIPDVKAQTYTGKAITPSITIKHGAKILTKGKDYQLYFTNNTMPGMAKVSIECIGNYSGSAERSFRILYKDVPEGHSFYDSVYWATDNNIASGYTGSKAGTFGVNDTISRGQVVMFLWRYAGTPEPKTTGQSFTDVPVNHGFYKAVQWAAENGIVSGYTGKKAGQFGINDSCTRAQIATFIWRFFGKPEPAKKTQTFSDVPTNYALFDAIQWGSENGIITGYPNGSFGVDKTCSRGQCVTFIYRTKGFLK